MLELSQYTARQYITPEMLRSLNEGIGSFHFGYDLFAELCSGITFWGISVFLWGVLFVAVIFIALLIGAVLALTGAVRRYGWKRVAATGVVAVFCILLLYYVSPNQQPSAGSDNPCSFKWHWLISSYGRIHDGCVGRSYMK